MKQLGVVILAAAVGCGDNAATLDAPAAVDAARPPCSATFAGNFAETSSGGSDCPMIAGGGTLDFAIASTTLASSLAVSIDLGPTPSPGTYSPEIVPAWSALVTSHVNSACVYSAGPGFVPNGSFTLVLDDVSPMHGSLELDEWLHALLMTDCGAVTTETVVVTF